MYHLNCISVFAINSPTDTYIYDVVPVSNGLVAAISSDDSLRVVDPLDLGKGELSLMKDVGKDITCLRGIGSGTEESGTTVVTAGRDGFVKIWDLRSGAKVGEVKSGEFVPRAVGILDGNCCIPKLLLLEH
jgi:WD40 repeat protein